MAPNTYGCEYCNGRVDVDVRDGKMYCEDCGSFVGFADSSLRLQF